MIELPIVAEELAEELGLDLALRIVNEFGGTSIWVPKLIPSGHRLEQLLGAEGSAMLAARFAGVLRVPRCVALLIQRRNIELRRRHASGESATKLALAYRMTERHVWRILAGDEPEPDPRQGSLF